MIHDLQFGAMSLRLLHLVLWVAVPAVLGILLVLAVRMVPPREGGRQTVERGTVAQHATSDDGRPAKRASPPQPLDDPTTPPPASRQGEVIPYRYKVIKVYPHDRRCFTQGLVYEDGFVYEGTGLYGQSALYKRDLQTGQTVKMLRLPDKYFGEGVTLFGDKLIQLTWQSQVGFVYKKDTFTALREFKYAGEGWGLTQDGKHLILSNGTATLRLLDPNTYAETGRIVVRDQGRPVQRLNELEYVAEGPYAAHPTWRGRPALASRGQDSRVASEVQGQDALVTEEQGRDALATAGTVPAEPRIYANIWQSDQIVIIDPGTGRVAGRIDLSGLWTPPADEQGDAVLNGIAYLPETKHLLVTGKLWPRMYEIELLPALP
jgi:glutamine cyclotransferase